MGSQRKVCLKWRFEREARSKHMLHEHDNGHEFNRQCGRYLPQVCPRPLEAKPRGLNRDRCVATSAAHNCVFGSRPTVWQTTELEISGTRGICRLFFLPKICADLQTWFVSLQGATPTTVMPRIDSSQNGRPKVNFSRFHQRPRWTRSDHRGLSRSGPSCDLRLAQ